jgi:large subunit ribosomal protein L49
MSPSVALRAALPYHVKRTVNNELPVYKIFRSNGKQINTILRHITGDYIKLKEELANICESPVRIKIGSLEIKGIHTWKIKEFLESKNL